MSRKVIKSPQEKKTLSLTKDHRNTYGANQKASRKAIPLRKALENRRVRHESNAALAQVDPVDEAALNLVESSICRDIFRVGGWQKVPDAPLGEVVERAKAARERRAEGKARSRFPYKSDDPQ